MGGMQALQWIVDYPLFVQKSLIIAATPRHGAQTIAFNEVGKTGNSKRSQLGTRGIRITRDQKTV